MADCLSTCCSDNVQQPFCEKGRLETLRLAVNLLLLLSSLPSLLLLVSQGDTDR